MDRRLKLGLAAAFGAIALAACTPDTPETHLTWDVNTHAGRTAAVPPSAVTPHQTARTYIYTGDNYAVPAPTPRPAVAPRPVAKQQPSIYDRPVYAQPGASGVFAWPANGRVISEFGATQDGARNDGINIALPQGAPIRAAASGTVSYSGDELKDYGNLLLIKHDGGYVTAYAHADQLLVQRGDFVAKGQVIGYAGHTGDVSSPQLHFEIRKGTTPVNPDGFLTQRSS